MSDDQTLEPMLDMYLFETGQLLEQLEQIILSNEKFDRYDLTSIDEIFRIIHTIKGASGMMMFDNIAILTHSIEDVFFYLREVKPSNVDFIKLSDLLLAGVDFIKDGLENVREGGKADNDVSLLDTTIKNYLEALKQVNPDSVKTAKTESVSVGKQSFFQATIFFEAGCEMENIRAYTVLDNLKNIVQNIEYIPDNIMEEDATAEIIRKEGFKISFSTEHTRKEIEDVLSNTILLRDFELEEMHVSNEENSVQHKQIILEDQADKILVQKEQSSEVRDKENFSVGHQSMISVDVIKLDKLMDLVGELVISEAMVTQNPDLKGLVLDNFSKAARQLGKITGDIQDTVMSIRMVPLTTTFHKMYRIVRDMCKKLHKEVQLELVGEATEVDKNIIEHIADPLMHLIRNAVDHGIECSEERVAAGKRADGKIILEAKNAGNDVFILIKDDGRGLDKEKILQRARENGLIRKPESELTDKEIFSFVFAPGFSTNKKVTEFSGRGVGMDVVIKNVNSIGGVVLIDSNPGMGTTITLKIPLTLAIVDGMTISVGDARYTVPITAIKESFKAKESHLVVDPDGNEMIMIRGQCYPILRIHRIFKVNTTITRFTDGIIIMVENESKLFCLFADELIGEQQVVVKALPSYIKNIRHVEGLAGCTLLGDGSISLILDISGLMQRACSNGVDG
jgi:two-component system, chemotaxis family, sensor kinase CheA